MTVLDTYERKARLTPGLYAVLPASITMTALGLDKSLAVASALGLLSATGGTWLLATLVGDVGRRAQSTLFNIWGGSPTTKALRLREPSPNPTQRDAWRNATEKLTGITLATATEEIADPDHADELIETATGQLLRLGQQGGEPAVRHENVAYGYQRNMYGFRNIGRTIAATAAAILVAAVLGPWHVSVSACTVGIVINIAVLALWIFLPSKAATKGAADRYTRQLYIAAQNVAR